MANDIALVTIEVVVPEMSVSTRDVSMTLAGKLGLAGITPSMLTENFSKM